MTFSEYFNALYPYLSEGGKPVDLFDEMIGHFIYEEAQDSCELLNCQVDTKRRYIKAKKPNKIKPDYAQYVYSKHYPLGYCQWLKDRLYQQDTYDRVEEWLIDNGIEFNDVCNACDALLETIFFHIAYPDAANGTEVTLPAKANGKNENSQIVTDTDRTLLKDFCIDFDGILEKCIASDHADVWFTHGLSVKIEKLYNEKWKERINEFEDIGLQSDILSTIATLLEFCKALDPSSQSTSRFPVRKLRIKLRDSYVKIHPDSYVDIFPYDAFIDDWADGREFEM